MNIEQIDRYCDLYEQRLKDGDDLSAEQFLVEVGIPPDEAKLLSELHKVHREYGDARYAPTVSANGESDAGSVADDVPALPERYRPVAEIARGGMGAVWRVVDRQFDRPLAVKVMLAKLVHEPAAVARFEREAHLTGSLQHPGVPPVVDRGQLTDGSPYFSMKLVEGETLSSVLAARGAPADIAADLPRRLGIFEQVCHAVGYAHAQGIIHRDLKPANVMVGAFGEVQVMDWGMAKRLADGPLPPGASETATSCSHALDADSTIVGGGIGCDEASDTAEDLTRAGTVLGTPAYMPPEQARGETDLDARSDVFGLGAILCEVLSGQRPYSGGDAWQQASRGDLREAFARLEELSVDQELVDLCQRCLASDPSERPSDGSAVAEGIQRWSATVQARLEQEKAERAAAEARAVEEAKRAGVERSRRRVLLALAAALLFLVTGGGAAAWWYSQDRIARQTEARINSENAEREIEDLLARSAELRNRYDFATAATLLAQTEARLGALARPEELTERTAQAMRDLTMVEELHSIRIRKSTFITNEGLDPQFANGNEGAYAKAFRTYGLDVAGNDPVEPFSQQVARADISDALLAALDDWSSDDESLRDRLLLVARTADDEPVRQSLRDPRIWHDREALVELARQADVASLAPATTVSLARRLTRVGETSIAADVLSKAALLHPQEFWLPFELAALSQVHFGRVDDAIGYCRTAIAAFPGSATVHNNLGVLLIQVGRLEEAETAFRRAIELDENHAGAHANLGGLLTQTGRWEAGEEACRKAIAIDPEYAQPYANIGTILMLKRQLDQAEAAFCQAIQLDPDVADAHSGLGMVLLMTDRVEAAEAACRRALELDPNLARAHSNLGMVLKGRGLLTEAEEEYRQAIALESTLAQAHHNLGNLLRDTGRLDEAETAFRHAIEADPENAETHNGLGNVLKLLQRMPEAETAYRRAVELDPQHAEAIFNVGLLVLLRDPDRMSEALTMLERGHALGSATEGWPYPSAGLIAQVRMAVVLDHKLAELARGETEPVDSAEALALADFALALKNRPALAARLFEEHLDDASLDVPLQFQYTYNAACAAARVAAGAVEEGAPEVAEAERRTWRARSLYWLNLHLAICRQLLATDSEQAREAASEQLAHCLEDPDLATLRDTAIDQLPADEQPTWRQFWADVESTLESVTAGTR